MLEEKRSTKNWFKVYNRAHNSSNIVFNFYDRDFSERKKIEGKERTNFTWRREKIYLFSIIKIQFYAISFPF